jgi:hypothetical protein
VLFLYIMQSKSLKPGDCNLDEEEVLVALMKRRMQLEEEAEARRSTTDSLTPVPIQSTTAGIDHDEEQTQHVEENLMDMEATDDEGTHPSLTTKFSTTPTATAIATLFSPVENPCGIRPATGRYCTP